MRKLREKLNNKRGFTLVELIVVIVIILILAAVLVPNVMRYIRQAREAAFKEEAAAYLTEVQGYEAEYYANEKTDLTDALWPAAKTTYGFALTGETTKTTISWSYTAADAKISGKTTGEVTVGVENGVVKQFSYATTGRYINWAQATGWTDIGY